MLYHLVPIIFGAYITWCPSHLVPILLEVHIIWCLYHLMPTSHRGCRTKAPPPVKKPPVRWQTVKSPPCQNPHARKPPRSKSPPFREKSLKNYVFNSINIYCVFRRNTKHVFFSMKTRSVRNENNSDVLLYSGSTDSINFTSKQAWSAKIYTSLSINISKTKQT